MILATPPTLLPLTRTLRTESARMDLLHVDACGTATRTTSQVHCVVMLHATLTNLKFDAYMLTGAGGGIGRIIVASAAQSGARHVVLVSRTMVCTANDSLVTESYGFHCADATAALPSAHGVLHAAGLLRDGIASTWTFAMFAVVFSPKVCTQLSAWTFSQESDEPVVLAGDRCVESSCPMQCT